MIDGQADEGEEDSECSRHKLDRLRALHVFATDFVSKGSSFMHLGIQNISCLSSPNVASCCTNCYPPCPVAHLVISQYFLTTATSFARFDLESKTWA